MVVVGQGFARQLEQDFVARASAAAVEVLDYYDELLDDRAAHPRDDLLSALAADMPEDEDGRRDLIANCFFFVEAGHATTTSLISAGTLLLLEHPDQLLRLRKDPGLVSTPSRCAA